jgi:DNA-directed RNA polymerase specialized sigma24 family protein
VLSLRYAEEQTLAQISAAVGRSVDGIKSLLKRLRKALADCVRAKLARTPSSEGASA